MPVEEVFTQVFLIFQKNIRYVVNMRGDWTILMTFNKMMFIVIVEKGFTIKKHMVLMEYFNKKLSGIIILV